MIDPSSSIGIYRIELVLSDDNMEDPMQTSYRFDIQIKEKPQEEVIEEKEQPKPENETTFIPNYSIKVKKKEEEVP